MTDYKKIIKNRNLRIKLVRLFDFLPDDFIVKLQYHIKTGNTLSLTNPKRYTEKLQWYKLFYRDSLMEKCVDKYLVRDYLTEKGYASILNSIIGIYDNASEIDFNLLPNKFVIKDTLGSGGSSVIICTRKDDFDWNKVTRELNRWTNTKWGKHPGREWVYDNKKHRIIIESYIESEKENGGLIDYKFFCFNGKVSYIYGISDRNPGKGACLGIYDSSFVLLPYQRVDEKPLNRVITRPNNFNEMINIAENLSIPFPHARIDLYNQNEKILFSEITFFDGSGYMTFHPDEFDKVLGDCFILPERNL